MTIIAADVGGTKTHLAVVKANTACDILHEAIYPSQQYSSFAPLLQNFINDSGVSAQQLNSLSVALPGVVNETQAQLTNLPWVLHKQALKDEFKLDEVRFLNDFQASAAGISCLRDSDKIIIQPGKPVEGETRVVVGAGSGLGLAWAQSGQQLDNNKNRSSAYTTFSTEGGHVDFAPTTPLQIQLLQYLMQTYRHVSYERLLSGAGLETIYTFLSSLLPSLSQDIHSVDNPATAPSIVARANSGDVLAAQALTLFTEIYAAYIGNLALVFKPAGGIYITGGIAAKIKSWLCTPAFVSILNDKGRMRGLVETIPVILVTNESVGVFGAIAEANRYNPE